MSFEDIANSDYKRKSKEVIIKHNEKEYKFTANELTYSQRLSLAIAQKNGEDALALLVVLSITDEHGKRMTAEQAEKLPEEYFSALFIAANEVNHKESEKN